MGAKLVAKLRKHFNVLNPFERERGLTYRQIVQKDLELIRKSDLLVAWLPFPSVGTSMEILYAKSNGIPVYIITSELKSHPWIRFYANKIFETYEELENYLVNLYYGKSK